MTEHWFKRSRHAGLVLAVLALLLLVACGGETVAPSPDPAPGNFAITGVTLSCPAGTEATITVSWSESEGADTYTVLRDGTELATVPADQTSHTAPLAAGTSGSIGYVVTAASDGGSTSSAPFTFEPGDLNCGETQTPDQPTDPEDPDEPDEPTGPEDPDDPDEPTGPEDPDDSDEPASNGRRLASFGSTNLAIDADGNVWAWGHNADGLLGQGNLYPYLRPVQVPLLSDVISVDLGASLAVALTTDGTVWTWGTDHSGDGLPGLPGHTEQLVPKKVENLPPINSLDAGSSFVLAVDEEGDIWGWGSNGDGQLAIDPTLIDFVDAPRRLTDAGDVTQVSAGDGHALALHASGTVTAWGDNDYGELGVGDTVPSHEPQTVPEFAGATQVVAGLDHSFALLTDGTVLGAGRHWYMGDDALTAPVLTPQPIPGLAGVTFISSSSGVISAVLADGSAVMWGNSSHVNDIASWIDDQTANVVPIPGSSFVTAVANGDQHVLLLTDEGTVLAVGSNYFYQVAPTTPEVITDFTAIELAGGFLKVSTSESHTLALLADNSVWGWGWGLDMSGALGIGDAGEAHTSPVRIPGLGNIIDLDVQAMSNIALDSGGAVWTWGDNSYGQLGVGDFNRRDVPTKVAGYLDGVRVTQVSMGLDFAMALSEHGTVYVWGTNSYGQLAANLADLPTSTVPMPVAGSWIPQDVVGISAGERHALVVTEAGEVHGWGLNLGSELGLGIGTPGVVEVPQRISTLSDVRFVSAGSYANFAIHTDGTLSAWGRNQNGALGVGSGVSNEPLPVVLNGLSDVHSISNNATHVLAVTDSGELYGWGDSLFHQLGAEHDGEVFGPTKLKGLAAGVVAAGPGHSIVELDGVLHGSGWDQNGQLGLGRVWFRRVPTAVGGLPPM